MSGNTMAATELPPKVPGVLYMINTSQIGTLQLNPDNVTVFIFANKKDINYESNWDSLCRVCSYFDDPSVAPTPGKTQKCLVYALEPNATTSYGPFANNVSNWSVGVPMDATPCVIDANATFKYVNGEKIEFVDDETGVKTLYQDTVKSASDRYVIVNYQTPQNPPGCHECKCTLSAIVDPKNRFPVRKIEPKNNPKPKAVYQNNRRVKPQKA